MIDQKIPNMLYLETTNICNANCIFCVYQYDIRPKKVMDFELLKKVTLRYKEAGGKQVSLSPFAGEVFSDSDFFRKTMFLYNLGFERIYTYTNALLFHKLGVENILKCGLKSINISLAPLEKELYIKIYRNKNYEQLKSNLQSFLKMFYELQDKTIQNISIEFRSHISMQEIENLDDYKEIIAPYIGPNIKVGAMRIFDSWMGMIKQEDLLEGMKIKNHKFLKSTPCARLDMLQVLSNGDTRICGCRWNHNKAVL